MVSSKTLLCASTTVFGAIVSLAHLTLTAMRESPLDSFRLYGADKVIAEKDIATFNKKGIVVIDHVLTSAELQKARSDIAEMVAANKFEINMHEDDRRSDLLFWVCETVGKEQKVVISDGLLSVLRIMRGIPYSFCKEEGSTKMGVPLVSQLSCYGNGSRYAAHRDSPPSRPSFFTSLFAPGIGDREITFILYLNEETWDDSAGGLQNSGNLSCYLDADPTDETGETATKVLTISPIGGRLVVFDSRRILHEVRPSHQQRFALTTWVGGGHSENIWLRKFCIPADEIDWEYISRRFWGSL